MLIFLRKQRHSFQKNKGSIIENDSFIKKIKKKYLKKNTKEIPSLRKIKSYCSKDKVIKIVCKEIGKDLDYIKSHKGANR